VSAAHGSPAPRALLLDLDGTLYPLGIVRRRMAIELLAGWAAGGLRGAPFRGAQTIRRLKVFRAMREAMRSLGRGEELLRDLQYSLPAQTMGMEAQELEALVVEWMHERPLKHLRGLHLPNLRPFLVSAREAGARLGVFSDYSPTAKLEALGVRDLLDLELAATDVEINAFKPHPAGFLRACEEWGLAPQEVMFVGDRDELDGEGARAAGMGVCILAPGAPGATTSAANGIPDWVLPDLGSLASALGWPVEL
jgi:putative hydrolase of the HAD superfamily